MQKEKEGNSNTWPDLQIDRQKNHLPQSSLRNEQADAPLQPL